jgi:5-methyltetrahydrofolate--homocysteine methyltransferase
MTSKEEILEDLRSQMVEVNVASFSDKLDEAIKSGLLALEIVESLTRGLRIVGDRYQKGDYFLAELITAGTMMTTGMKKLKPLMRASKKSAIGKAVVGTVQGDLHDIGKNIVAVLLKSEGFEVYDLGVDVTADGFANKVREVRADILALSALITTTMPTMRQVIDELIKRKSRNSVKVIIGGAPTTEDFAKDIGSDGYARDAVTGVAICKEWMRRIHEAVR